MKKTMCPFDYTAVAVSGKVERLVNRFNHTSWVTAVTPTDRPKSVRSGCVIKVFGGVFIVVTLLFGLFCGCRGFCHRTESDLFPFSLIKVKMSKALIRNGRSDILTDVLSLLNAV